MYHDSHARATTPRLACVMCGRESSVEATWVFVRARDRLLPVCWPCWYLEEPYGLGAIAQQHEHLAGRGPAPPGYWEAA